MDNDNYNARSAASVAISIVLVGVVTSCVLRVVNWVWLKPKRLEKCMREQGLNGNSYRLLVGDMKEFLSMGKEALSTPIKLSDDVVPRTLPYFSHIVKKHGKNSYGWFGPTPRVNVVEPALIKEILSRPNEFQKPHPEPFGDKIVKGLLNYEGHKWAKHRKIINPAFHLDKLKNMLPAIYLSCTEMVNKWESLMPTSCSTEVDVWPYVQDLSGAVISRTSFGSNHEEGRKIFQLQKEQIDLVFQQFMLIHIPGWSFIPTKANRRMKEISKELHSVLRGIINKREKTMNMESVNRDLLGILMESNSKEIKEHGVGMSIEEVIEECKLFYFAGSETTSSLIVWTLVLLSKHSNWQARAREEVSHVFGNNKLDFDGLNRLKTVTMILYEVLRLYSPLTTSARAISKTTKLGNMTLPVGVEFHLQTFLLHHDPEIWGEDAEEFNPERFSQGVSNATKDKGSFLPFGFGPRICIGQNFAMIEAKMALATILQHFSFELSPSYKHAPCAPIILQPQHGVPLILHKL